MVDRLWHEDKSLGKDRNMTETLSTIQSQAQKNRMYEKISVITLNLAFFRFIFLFSEHKNTPENIERKEQILEGHIG